MTTRSDATGQDSGADAVVVLTSDGRILHWNAGAELLFGYSEEDARGQILTDLVVPPERRQDERQALDDVLQQGSITYEGIRERKDGTWMHVTVASRVVRGHDGKVDVIVEGATDVTAERAKRDAAIVATKFRDLLESVPDGIVMVNPLGRIVLANTQLEQLFGYQTGELIGSSIEVLLPNRLHAVHVKHRSSYFAQPRARAMGAGLDLYGRRRDGSEFPVEISLSPLHMAEGTFAMSAVRDITERRRIERSLHDKNIELEKAAAAKNRFLATMSHELRTPLNAIIGFTGTLLMKLPGPLTQEQEKQLSTIQTSGRHLLSLINDLLDLARIESGKVELTLRAVSCRDVVAEVAATLEPLAAKKGLAFEVRLPAEDIIVQSDQRTLSQIVINLASNAIKYTERGRVLMTLERPELRGRRQTVIRVEDTGCGIRPEDQARLFQAFEQLDSASTRKYEGTGLGLHVSQRLATLLGGRIQFHSVFGEGSTFALVLEEEA